MATEIRPFANGSQFCDWCEKNCGNCKKASQDWNGIDGDRPQCEIEVALWIGDGGSGIVTPEIAARMNYTTPDGRDRRLNYSWPCNEIEPMSDEVAEAVKVWRERDAKEAAILGGSR